MGREEAGGGCPKMCSYIRSKRGWFRAVRPIQLLRGVYPLRNFWQFAVGYDSFSGETPAGEKRTNGRISAQNIPRRARSTFSRGFLQRTYRRSAHRRACGVLDYRATKERDGKFAACRARAGKIPSGVFPA